MADQVLERKITKTSSIPTIRVGGRQPRAMAFVVALVAVALAAVPILSGDRGGVAAPVQADAARWQALAAAEFPAAAPGVQAQTDRWEALTEAYQSGAILTAGRQAELSRWEAIAASHLVAQSAATARWVGLADHHLALSRGNQAWADRYQGLVDDND